MIDKQLNVQDARNDHCGQRREPRAKRNGASVGCRFTQAVDERTQPSIMDAEGDNVPAPSFHILNLDGDMHAS